MTVRVRVRAGILVTALFATACAGVPTSLGTREPIAFDPDDRIDYAVTECGAQLLIFLPVFTTNRVARAMKLVEARAGDRYVASVRLRERWTYLIFGEIYCTDVLAATYGRPKIETAISADAPPR